jgi:hypothetical protein
MEKIATFDKQSIQNVKDNYNNPEKLVNLETAANDNFIKDNINTVKDAVDTSNLSPASISTIDSTIADVISDIDIDNNLVTTAITDNETNQTDLLDLLAALNININDLKTELTALYGSNIVLDSYVHQLELFEKFIKQYNVKYPSV